MNKLISVKTRGVCSNDNYAAKEDPTTNNLKMQPVVFISSSNAFKGKRRQLCFSLLFFYQTKTR